MSLSTSELESKHRPLLDQALAATRSRDYFSAYPESPSPRVYGETAAADGKTAFESLLGKEFPLTTPGASGTVATEKSPFGLPLDVAYSRVAPDGLDALLSAARAGMPGWRDAGPLARTAVCIEILARLHARVFELANAVQHTSGQAFVMAFQAGGTHALDRGLEALAYAYDEMTRHPRTAIWEKPGRDSPIRMEKTFTTVPRGVALVVGCNTFPTWNSWPGFFASLATGNPVVVKPHPGAVLPLAITVQVAREVLEETGFAPDLVSLAAEDPADRLAATLATRPEVKLVDFTGSSAFGEWLEQHATQAVVFTEKSGVNTVVVDSTDSFRGLCSNLAFSLSLYSGQMCTAPQNVYLPADGIETDEEHKSYDEVGAGIAAALDKLIGDDKRAVELLGGIVNDGVLNRLESLPPSARVMVESREVRHPAFDDAVVRTPAVLGIDASDTDIYEQECFGPVSYLIATSGTGESLQRLRSTVTEHGAMTASVYSTSDEVIAAARSAALDAGVALSENLTGPVYVNQSAAFSDFHGTGANPAATASYTDAAFVAPRFRIVQSRRHI
ncbi:MAG: phenylacetic acid degradation protein PaaN [Propionibacteriales bacterium]|nr:phenylacetic acid degradation protein PaaN [Propionibacteriales bacterium]